MTKQETGLISRNITINGKRTSVRMEQQMWLALQSIAKREQCSIHDLCSLVVNSKKQVISMTASLRIFIMMYFKAAATEEGHKRAGHGDFAKMRARGRGTNIKNSEMHHKEETNYTGSPSGLKRSSLQKVKAQNDAQPTSLIPHYSHDISIAQRI